LFTLFLKNRLLDKQLSKKLNAKNKIAWRNYYTGQNLLSVRVASAIFFLLNGIIRILFLAFPPSLTHAENFPEFNTSNWIFFGSSFLFYLLSDGLIGYYRKKKKATAIMSLIVFSFAIFLIFCGMYSSFIATANPHNSIIFYLVPLIIVSLVWVFEFYETLLLMISTELFFTSLLISSHTFPTEMVYNQLISLLLLGGFLFISRHFAAYKKSNFLQVNEIREKNREIEKISEFKSQLLGTVAHDLRNPLATIETMTMVMEMDEIDKELKENLHIIKASCVQARTIIDELLESARNQNNLEFVIEKTELNDFLQDIIDEWDTKKGSKTIELIGRVVPAYVKLNHEKFHRVMDNLISNALKFSKEDSKITVILSKKDGRIILEVQDNGIGIPKEKLPIIFEAFTKAGRPGINGEQSTGLGLSIVKQIVEKHDGTIEAESEERKGSVFRIVLPEGR
jgi:two-component system sensor histidine kinase VicK